MLINASALVAAAVVFGFSTYVGVIPVHRMIHRREAQHELRRGSASYFRRMGGLALVGMWLVAILFVSSIIGDWAVTGDYDGAMARAGMRIGLLIQLAASFGGGR